MKADFLETEMENKNESDKSQIDQSNKRKNIQQLESGVNHATNKTLVTQNSRRNDSTIVPPLVQFNVNSLESSENAHFENNTAFMNKI